MVKPVKFFKVIDALPPAEELEADAFYFVRTGAGFSIFLTNSAGTAALPINRGEVIPEEPEEPEEPPVELPERSATSLWVGAVTTSSLMVSAYTEDGAETLQAFAQPVSGGAPIYGQLVTVSAIETVNPATLYPPENYGVGLSTIEGLSPDSEYEIGVRVNGRTTAGITGKAKTRPNVRKAFTFGFGTCFELGTARTYNNFDVMAEQALDFFAVLDDRGYADIGVNDPRLYYRADWGLLHHPKIGAFHRAFPIYYVAGDHDFGPNNSNAASPGKPAFMNWYRNHVPQPLTAMGANDPVHYAVWIAPGLKLVMPDTRTNRIGGMFMDADQEAWFIGQIQEVGAIPGACMIWNSGVPWISNSDTDTWFGAAAQRQRIADAVLQYAPGRVAIICGDMHALAFDDGRNSAGGMPVMHAAPMARTVSTKGGPYSAGTPITATQNQYGQLGVVPIEGGWELNYRGYSCDPTTGAQTLRLERSVILRAPAYVAPAFDGESSISGGTSEGSVLTANPGPVSGNPSPEVSYSWLVDDVYVPNAFSRTFARPDGVGSVPSVEITLENGIGNPAVRRIAAEATTPRVAAPSVSYRQAVLDTSPQFLLLNPSGAEIVDESPNGRNAAIVGTQGTHTPSAPLGLPVFRGTPSSYVRIAHDEAFNQGGYSAAFFLNVNGSNVQFQSFYGRDNNEKIGNANADLNMSYVRWGPTGHQIEIPNMVNASDWHFIVMTRDAADRGQVWRARLGQALTRVADMTAPRRQISTQPIVFNGRLVNGVFDRGGNIALAGMARWGRALSEAEIQGIYQAAVDAAAA